MAFCFSESLYLSISERQLLPGIVFLTVRFLFLFFSISVLWNTSSTVSQPTFLLGHPLVIFVGSTVHNKSSFYCFKNHLFDFLDFDSKTFCWGWFCILLRNLWASLMSVGFLLTWQCFVTCY